MNTSAAVIQLVDPQEMSEPYRAYAIRFPEEHRARGFSLLLEYTTEFGGMPGGILVVYKKDLVVLDRASVNYDRLEMSGQGPEEILAYWDAQTRQKQLPSQESPRRPSLGRTLVQAMKEWYGSR